MKRWIFPTAVLGLFAAAIALAPSVLLGQSTATASRAFEPSVFLGLSGNYTGLNGGRNLGLTAGLDVGFHPFFGLLPSIEVRGTYPMASGQVAGEESVEAGLRVQKRFRRIRPYADFLFGRGQLNYQSGGYIVPLQDFRYLQSTTNILSPGIGFETDITQHFALLLDGQLQHWDVPFDPTGTSNGSGSIYSKIGTVGVVYRFGWLDHGHPAP